MENDVLYREYLPALALRPFVDRYWIFEAGKPFAARSPQRVVPTGKPELIFHLGDPYRFRHADGRTAIMMHGVVGGQLQQHMYLEPTGESKEFCIRFKPSGLIYLMDVPMHETTDNAYRIEDVYGGPFKYWVEQVVSAADTAERVRIVEDFLLQKLAEKDSHPHFIDWAVDWVFKHPAGASVRALTEQLRVSERQLERLFKSRVGVPPKLFIRIVRLNHAFKKVRQGAPLDWLDLTYECGYYDQAHFSKDFKLLTGESPSGYFARCPAWMKIFQGS